MTVETAAERVRKQDSHKQGPSSTAGEERGGSKKTDAGSCLSGQTAEARGRMTVEGRWGGL